MLQNLLYILLISFIAISWGLPLLFFQQKRIGNSYQLNIETIIFSFFAGLVFIGLVSSWVSLFFPVNYFILLIITPLIALYEFWWFRKHRQKKLLTVKLAGTRLNTITVFFLCAVLLFIFLASNQPAMDDTDLYHIQVIRWNQQYGSVPGLANLYLRYGFFSNWFHLISTFSLPFKNQNYLFLNLSLSIWIVLFLLYKLQYFLSNLTNKANRILGTFYFLAVSYMLIEWDLLRGNASSTSYDFIVTVLLLLVLLLITETFLLAKKPAEQLLLLLILCIAAPFFKLTGLPALFILLLYFLASRQSLKKYAWALVVFLLFLIPFITKNYIQTGYFLFPYASLSNNIKPDWQVPRELLTGFTDFISLGNKYINQPIPSTGSQYINHVFFSWIPVWMRHLTLFDKIISWLTLVSILISFFIPVFKQTKLGLFYYACVLIVPAWFFTAPDHRFAYGLIIFVSLLPISCLLENILKKKFVNAILALAIIVMIIYVFPKSKNFRAENLIHPPSILIPPYKNINAGGSILHLPEKINGNWNLRCYDTPLPCICQSNPYLEPRGKELKDGFRMKPITDSSFILHFNY